MVRNTRIAVIGLGYVGLPLAIEFAKKFKVVGFDTNSTRVDELNSGVDRTLEVENEVLEELRRDASSSEWIETGIVFSSNLEDIKNYNTYIVTVPTPIDQFKAPDLRPLLKATEMLSKVLKKGDYVIYESTVYPGCTEEECVPILEKFSGLKFNTDFFVGYSPERINPGDKINILTSIKKVTSGSTPKVAEEINQLYGSIIKAGTHKATSIKVAEASKAIENAQRDINISFVNELALIFDRLGIDTQEVIEAAGTKWNFLKYMPGLVGGHCIGVDPYYLAHKAQIVGYNPQVILSGRRVNDQMGAFVAEKVVKLMIQKELKIKGADILIMGITFKENCPDVRNTRVVDIYHELIKYGLNIDIYDPWADSKEVDHEYGVYSMKEISKAKKYAGIIVAVAHDEFKSVDYQSLKVENGVIYDIKGILHKNDVDGRL